MRILCTNDDGIYAPGLAALEGALARLGEVVVVAPLTEQSGVAHTITYRTPLMVHEAARTDDPRRSRGWAVEGSPADCVRLGVLELVRDVDLVVSGINSGLNAGINVLYSGTVAAAIEGAFFGITSIAVSLEYDDHADYGACAERAVGLIEQIIADDAPPVPGELFNVNFPQAALTGRPDVVVVPLGLERYGDRYLKRSDPKGNPYYWADSEGDPPDRDAASDTAALRAGKVTITPLKFDITARDRLPTLAARRFVIGG